MRPDQLIAALQKIVAEYPESASREVFVFSQYGKLPIDEVTVSITSNVYLIQK